MLTFCIVLPSLVLSLVAPLAVGLIQQPVQRDQVQESALDRIRPHSGYGTTAESVIQGLTVTQLILRERCLAWVRAGVTPLPEYCNQVMFSKQLPINDVLTYYETYLKTVPSQQQLQDLEAVKKIISSGYTVKTFAL